MGDVVALRQPQLEPVARPPATRKGSRDGITAKKGDDGRTHYYGRYVDVDGKRKNRLLSIVSRADAREVLTSIKERVRRGEIGVIERTLEDKSKAFITVQELGEKFTNQYAAPKIKDPKQYRREAKNILEVRVYPHIGQVVAAELTTRQVDGLIATLTAEEYMGSSVRSAVAALSRMFVWGRKNDIVACANPVPGCERPRTTSSLDFLSREEIVNLLDHAELVSRCYAASPTARSLYPIIAFCIYTGVRKGEALGLRWQDLHLVGAGARVDVLRSYASTPKSGKARHVPLNAEIVRILCAWRDDPHRATTKDGHVFPVEGRMGRREEVLELGALYTAAGVKRPAKPWHCLRHTFASHYMMAGGNILELQKLLGHSTLAMTQIYAHLSPDHLAAGIARMSFAAPSSAPLPRDGHQGDTDGNAEKKGPTTS